LRNEKLKLKNINGEYMGKNKKFKKKFRSEIISKLNQSNYTESNAAQPAVSSTAPDKNNASVNPQEFEVSQITSKDLKTILAIFGCLAIILVILYFVNKNTTYLAKFSDYLAKILNIN